MSISVGPDCGDTSLLRPELLLVETAWLRGRLGVGPTDAEDRLPQWIGLVSLNTLSPSF